VISFNHTNLYKEHQLSCDTTPNGRYYVTPEGDKYPSITTVLGKDEESIKGLDDWRKRVGETEARTVGHWAAHRGTEMHQYCEDYLNGIPIITEGIQASRHDPVVLKQFKQVKGMLDYFITDVHCIEYAFYSNMLGIAGRCDLVATFNGKLSIVDFKTSRKKKKREWIESYFHQTTAYAIMFEEMYGVKIESIVIAMGVKSEPKGSLFIENPDNWRHKTIPYLKSLLNK
jgi:genome maintenance exonuclease 1